MQDNNDLKDSEEVLSISLIPDFLVSLYLILGSPVLFALSFYIKTSVIFKVVACGVMIVAILIGIWEFGGLVKIVRKIFIKQG